MKEKTLYRREIAELTGMLIRSGLSKKEIIRLLAVEPERFESWIKAHRELRLALAGPTPEERAEADLVKRALGFQLNEATAEEIVDKKTGETIELLKRRTITKDVPPDVRALLFYLKSRWPGRWNEDRSDNFQYEASDVDEDL